MQLNLNFGAYLIAKTILIINLLFLSNNCNAEARLEPTNCCADQGIIIYNIIIDGVIDTKTVEEFTQIITADKFGYNAPKIVLNSFGGSVPDAMQLGRLIRKNSLMTGVFGKDRCLSACVLVLAAGVKRLAVGTVGIHRPHFDEMEFAQLPPDEARKQYETMEENVRNYLHEMGIPDTLFTTMQRISSDEVLILSHKQILDFALDGDDPAYMEYQRAKDITTEGKESYQINQSWKKVYTACLNHTNGDSSYCNNVITPLFNKRFDSCIASQGIDKVSDCATYIATKMTGQLQ